MCAVQQRLQDLDILAADHMGFWRDVDYTVKCGVWVWRFMLMGIDNMTHRLWKSYAPEGVMIGGKTVALGEAELPDALIFN